MGYYAIRITEWDLDECMSQILSGDLDKFSMHYTNLMDWMIPDLRVSEILKPMYILGALHGQILT